MINENKQTNSTNNGLCAACECNVELGNTLCCATFDAPWN